MTTLRILICVTALLLLSLPAAAQTVAHLNLDNLIDKMPEKKAADAQLNAYEKELLRQAWTGVEKALEEAYEKGQMSKFDYQTRLEELKQGRVSLLPQLEEARVKSQNKRAELLAPIVEKVQAAAKTLAIRNQIDLVLSTSLDNTVLFAPDSRDVEALILRELGIADASPGGMLFREARVVRLNSWTVLSEMPEHRQFLSSVEAFKSQLQKQGQQMMAEYRAAEGDLREKERVGVTQNYRNQATQGLHNREMQIREFQEQIPDELARKELELLQPIVENVKNVIRNVSSSNGIDYILEESIVLCCERSLDISPRIQAVLSGGPPSDSAIQSAGTARIGYLTSTAILLDLPEVKTMNSILQAMQTQLQIQWQQMAEPFQRSQEDVNQRYERGEISPAEMESIRKKLQADKDKILSFEQKVQEDLAKKEQELLKPILERFNKALRAVAAERNIDLIVESSMLIYGRGEYDLTSSVRAKLGI